MAKATMVKRSFPLSKVYQLLEPGPVVLVTTSRKGRTNIMTLSWHTMVEFEPPTVGCVISNRNYTFDILKATKECVINIPTIELAKQVVGCGNTTGKTIDKWKAFHLTPAAASCVTPPLINECFANLECKVVDAKMVSKYNLFILEVLKAWASRVAAAICVACPVTCWPPTSAKSACRKIRRTTHRLTAAGTPIRMASQLSLLEARGRLPKARNGGVGLGRSGGGTQPHRSVAHAEPNSYDN